MSRLLFWLTVTVTDATAAMVAVHSFWPVPIVCAAGSWVIANYDSNYTSNPLLRERR